MAHCNMAHCKPPLIGLACKPEAGAAVPAITDLCRARRYGPLMIIRANYINWDMAMHADAGRAISSRVLVTQSCSNFKPNQ